MSEQKLISPLLDNFVMGDPISNHHGVRCCPAMTKDADKRYIVKIISIPASQVQLDALLLAGAYSNQASALSYFKELAAVVAEEAEILKKLSRFEGFVPYEDLQIVPMEGKVGYDVYLLSPYKRSLERHMRKKPMTQLSAVNLGLDLCASMVMCRRAGFLYVDLKPGNIFINEKNEYCVGDLGFIRLSSLKYASLPDKYRSAYTAPELSDAMASLNETVDTYAIGMILYQVYNDGKLPQPEDAHTAPLYADYEMSEIILKAIAPDPADRWQDPLQMGQALVAYMQRNSVNDVPIIPLPEEKTEEPVPAETEPTEESAPEEEVSAEETPTEAESEPETPAEETAAEEDVPEEVSEDAEITSEEEPVETGAETEDASDLSFMDDMVSDETAPDPETADEISYSDLSDDTSDILAQADELLAMETPEPVVAPEPIDVPMPEPIVLRNDPEPEEETQTVAASENEESGETVSADPLPEESAPGEVSETDSDDEPEEDTASHAEDVGEYDDDEDDDEEDTPVAPAGKKNLGCLIAAILAIVILAGALLGGYYYYQNYYLQTISDLEIQGQENDLIVLLDTEIDETLLTVHCSDSYGNTRHSAVSDGQAIFENLDSDTIYKITVTIEGFHELRGEITGSYATPSQTKIVSFEATAGADNGSVILTFTVEGKDSNSWTVTYTADGENEKSETFSGHLVTISGLTAGKEYTFRLSSDDLAYIVGSDTVTFTVSAPVFAEDLNITSCNSDGITAVWSMPEDAQVENWIVHCYSDSGYDQTITTSELTATFTDINPSDAFTIEVTAEGMSMGTITYISARSATITEFTPDTSEPLHLTVTWEYTGTMPEGGWLVIYEKEGIEDPQIIQTTENTVSIYPAMPGENYNFTIQAADGTTVFDNTFSAEAGKVKVFSGYGVTADNMSFQLCRTPNKTDWKYSDLKNSDYTSTFSSGQKASLVVHLDKKYNTSDDIVDTLFVIRDNNDEIACISSSSSSWTYMWDGRYCELDIPVMPTESGSYTVSVYFNGMAAAKLTFTIR